MELVLDLHKQLATVKAPTANTMLQQQIEATER